MCSTLVIFCPYLNGRERSPKAWSMVSRFGNDGGISVKIGGQSWRRRTSWRCIWRQLYQWVGECDANRLSDKFLVGVTQ